MVCSQHSSLPWFFPFWQILASSAALKSDFCHLSEITLPTWTSRFVSRKYPQMKGWSNHGAHFTCFHSLKDHSAALPVSHFYSCLWWHGYSDMSYSVMMRSRGCSWSDFTLHWNYSCICLSSFVRLKASQGQSVNYSFLFILQSIVHSLIMLAG